jgi:putative AlgH/UPF0301 family transcriptional regulator
MKEEGPQVGRKWMEDIFERSVLYVVEESDESVVLMFLQRTQDVRVVGRAWILHSMLI